MRAMVVRTHGKAETRPLVLRDRPIPEPGPGEVRVRVSLCGVCRTDLHVVEGDLVPRRPEIVPGHEVVGYIDHDYRLRDEKQPSSREVVLEFECAIATDESPVVEIEGASRGVKKYYSREGWEINDGGDLDAVTHQIDALRTRLEASE